MTMAFELDGQEFVALNGGPHFAFSPAISLVVYCETQEEVDALWEKLSADGGETGRCAWLKDKYGVSWQIVPTILVKMLQNKDAEKSNRVMKAMLQMGKIDIEKLKRAQVEAGVVDKRRRPGGLADLTNQADSVGTPRLNIGRALPGGGAVGARCHGRGRVQAC